MLRFGFRATLTGRSLNQKRGIGMSLARPRFLFHDLPFVSATFDGEGPVRLEFDLELGRGQSLDRIRLDVVEADNGRLHPVFPGGTLIAPATEAPAGARLDLCKSSLVPAADVHQGQVHGAVHGVRPASYRKPAGRPRDAMIFSSWAPERCLTLGDAFIAMLLRHHADSKIFVGFNHGSSQQWAERLASSSTARSRTCCSAAISIGDRLARPSGEAASERSFVIGWRRRPWR